MTLPGEQLLAKLWETLSEKAIGNLLKPWQIRREGRAHLDVKREEALVLAQAEQDAAAIRSGEASLRSNGKELLLLANKMDAATSLPRISVEPRISEIEIDHAAVLRARHADSLRKEVNVARAVLHAEAALESDASEAPGESPSDDWLYRWRDYAAAVSAEELQSLWGRVLAGEVKSPGSYSPRFLSFLHNLSKDEAQTIAMCMPFVIGDFICSERKEHLEQAGLNLTKLMTLQELGVLNGVEGLGLSQSYAPKPGKSLVLLLCCGRHALGVRGKADKALQLKAYIVTQIGQQLARLGSFEADLNYLRAIGATIRSQGFEVEMGVPTKTPSGGLCLPNAEKL